LKADLELYRVGCFKCSPGNAEGGFEKSAGGLMSGEQHQAVYYCFTLVFRSPVGFRCKQRSAHVNLTRRGGDEQRGPVAEGTGNQKQMAEAQHNTTSAERFHSTMQV
jgi:hypothetical protein